MLRDIEIDMLVNMASVHFKDAEFNADVVNKTILTNYFGTKAVIEAFLPILKDDAHIVNVSSRAGKLSGLEPELKARFSSETLTVAELDTLMNEFMSSVADFSFMDKGWPKQPYEVSKVGISMLTRILAPTLKNGIIINCL